MLTSLRLHIVPLLFGVALMVFGCTNAQLQSASKAYDNRVSPATTQVATSIGQVSATVAATAPGTPVGNAAAIVAALAGIVLTLDKVISGSLKVLANSGQNLVPQTVPVTTGQTGPPGSVAAPVVIPSAGNVVPSVTKV